MARRRPADNFPKTVLVAESRTEEEKVTQASIEVILGGKPYQIKPLVIRESREWRKRLAKEIGAFSEFVGVDTNDPEKFRALVEANLVDRADAVIDLFFAYARDLSRDEIENTATDTEINAAFVEVLKIALPLAGGVTPAMGSLSQQVKPSS